MENFVLSQSFDCQYCRTILADCQHQAGIDPTSIEQDRARTALASVAPLLGASQIQTIAQQIQKGDPRVLQLDCPLHTIDGEGD
jgi:hypothetical protein